MAGFRARKIASRNVDKPSAPKLSALKLGWDLARKRLLKDVRDDFWPDLLGFEDVLGPANASFLTQRLELYKPTCASSLSIPKKNLTVRDSLVLHALDRLVYQALVDGLLPELGNAVSDRSYSHKLTPSQGKWMYERPTKQWERFMLDQSNAISQVPQGFVVVTDISNFFEGIAIDSLLSAIGARRSSSSSPTDSILEFLYQCLRAWTPYKSHGIVQNCDASSFLANVFLTPFDHRMESLGYPFFRYMDDVRVVVPSEAEARVVLMKVIRFLRELGLGVNASKTEIVACGSPSLAKHVPRPNQRMQSIEAAMASKDASMVQKTVPDLIAGALDAVRAVQANDRLVRFYLGRITNVRELGSVAVPNTPEIDAVVIRRLVDRPDLTDTWCKYLEGSKMSRVNKEDLRNLISDEPLIVYEWQRYLLWRLAGSIGLRGRQLTSKALAALNGEDHCDVAGAAYYLARVGTDDHVQLVCEGLVHSQSTMAQRARLVACQRLNRKSRNRMYEPVDDEPEELAALKRHLRPRSKAIYGRAGKLSLSDLPDAIGPSL